MSVTAQTPRVAYNCNGSLTTFSITFSYLDEDDIDVYHLSAAGVETLLTQGSDYTVDTTTHEITTVSTYPSGDQITIIRNTALTQPLDLQVGGSLPAEALEDGLDRLVMQAQEVNNQFDRAVHVPVSEANGLELPPAADRAGLFFGFDLSGNAIAASDIGTTAVVSSFAETLLDDTSAAAMLTTLGITSFVQTILEDANAAAVFTTLGISTLIQALLTNGSELLGLMNLDLTNRGNNSQPAIVAGGRCEINGALYSNSTELAITGTTANSTWYDILLTPSGSTYTASFVARETGSWDAGKKGMYSGNNRVIGCVYRDGSGNYLSKNLLHVVNGFIDLVLETGPWDMSSTAQLDIPHGLTTQTDIVNVDAWIRDDDGNYVYSFWGNNYTPDDGAPRIYLGNISLITNTAGSWNHVNYDSTTINRGAVLMKYKVF